LLYEDETILWRFALPRAGWWRKAQRARLPTRPLNQSQIKREESLKRQAWLRYRSWSRVTNGVLLSVLGAVQYGTSKVFYKIVVTLPIDLQDWNHSFAVKRHIFTTFCPSEQYFAPLSSGDWKHRFA
jgi:hypothetical protein